MNKIIEVGERFWNIRTPFRVFGMVDIGTHASLIQLENGGFVLLDSVTIDKNSKMETKINKLTHNGKLLKAIINLHPFHSVSINHMHERFSGAKLYGTKRHHKKFPSLPWQPEITESEKFNKIYKQDLDFHVPKGVNLVTANPNVHFSSVIAWHKPGKTIHVDDTFGYAKDVPLLARALISEDNVSLHPMLKEALEKRANAGQDFLDWLESFIDTHRDAQNLCTAHNSCLLATENKGESIYKRLKALLTNKLKKLLSDHDKKYAAQKL